MNAVPDPAPGTSPGEWPPRPIAPKDEDCCRSDCVNCVFNLYDRALEAWTEEVERIERERRQRPASGTP